MQSYETKLRGEKMKINSSIIHMKIKFNELESEFQGDYDSVWRLTNKFLLEVSRQFRVEKQITTIKGKNVPDIILKLRDQGYFDSPKSSKDTIEKMSELGKTNITDNAIRMALKDLTERGSIKREKKGKEFQYNSPWVE